MKSRFALSLVLAATLSPGLRSQAQPGSPQAPSPTLPPQAPRPAPPPRPSGPVEVNGIAAKVNGAVVTRNQVYFMLAPVVGQLSAQFPRRGKQFESEVKEAQAKILQELIDRQIILDEFKLVGGSIKPFVIDEEIKRQMRELFNGDENKFREELKRSRLTMDGYRKMTHEKIAVQAMRSQQFADAPPPLPNEIQKEYDEIKLSLRDPTKDVITFQKIFIPATDAENPLATPDSQLTHAEDLAKQIASGKDFGEIAKANSKDAYSEQGGLQENVPRTDLSPEFGAIICDAPPGKIIGPLLDREGFTIAKVIKIDYGPYPPLDKVREMIEERVRKKKTSAQYDRWIESRRKRAMIDVRM
jgi:peptidyl-prolyl cis-trans isomerase SurA